MTPEQADRVVDLWVERNLRFTEMGGSSLERPSEAMQTEMKRAGEAEQMELRALLGEEKYGAVESLSASSQERGEVSQLRLELGLRAVSLGDRQADALVEAIYSERQRRTREYEEYVRSVGITDRNVVSPQDRQRWLDLEKEANQRIHDGVAGTLSRASLLTSMKCSRPGSCRSRPRSACRWKESSRRPVRRRPAQETAMRVLLIALTLTTAAFAVTTVHFWRDRDEQRARADSLEARVTALEAAPAARLKSAQRTTPRQTRLLHPQSRVLPVARSPPRHPQEPSKGPQVPDTGED